MTALNRPVSRVAVKPLNGEFGPDRNKRLVVTLTPGTEDVPDTLTIRPIKTRRGETITVLDVYRFAMRSRVNAEVLAKARAKKERKATRLAAQRMARAERRLFADAH